MKNLNNTVIKVLTREHGKEVIKWWKEQGVQTYYKGNEDNWFYGIINEKFDAYTLKQVQAAKAKIIELPEFNSQDLIGRKVRGFKFDSGTDGVYWCDIMQKYVGKIGTIIATKDTHFLVNFGDKDEWEYPQSLIEDYLVDEGTNVETSEQNVETSKIIDLSNVEGVEMMVKDQKDETPQKIRIKATINGRFIDFIGNAWYYAEHIKPVPKYTMEELEKIVAQLIKEATELNIKEVNNER